MPTISCCTESEPVKMRLTPRLPACESVHRASVRKRGEHGVQKVAQCVGHVRCMRWLFDQSKNLPAPRIVYWTNHIPVKCTVRRIWNSGNIFSSGHTFTKSPRLSYMSPESCRVHTSKVMDGSSYSVKNPCRANREHLERLEGLCLKAKVGIWP